MKAMSPALELYYSNAPYRELAEFMCISEDSARYRLCYERKALGLEPRKGLTGRPSRAKTIKEIEKDKRLDDSIDDIIELFKAVKPLSKFTITRRYNVTFPVMRRALIRKLGEAEADKLEAGRAKRALDNGNVKKRTSNLRVNVDAKKALAMGSWL